MSSKLKCDLGQEFEDFVEIAQNSDSLSPRSERLNRLTAIFEPDLNKR
jgi:hypothetical protein